MGVQRIALLLHQIIFLINHIKANAIENQ